MSKVITEKDVLYFHAFNENAWREHIEKLHKDGKLRKANGEIDFNAIYDFPVDGEFITYEKYMRLYPNSIIEPFEEPEE